VFAEALRISPEFGSLGDMDKTKIMFVCTGNICRSPLAQAVFEHHARLRGLEDRFVVESSGLQSFHVGEQADNRMRSVAREHGVRLDHLARQVQPRDLRDYDFVLAMDRGHLQELRRMTGGEPELTDKVRLFGEFDPAAEKATEVPDPYYGGIDGFEQVFEIVDRTARNLMEQLVEADSSVTRGRR